MQCALAERPSLSTYRLSQLGSSGLLSFSFHKELKKKKMWIYVFHFLGLGQRGLLASLLQEFLPKWTTKKQFLILRHLCSVPSLPQQVAVISLVLQEPLVYTCSII